MNKITSFLLLVFLSSSCTSETLLVPVKIDGKWGYIDKNGKITIKPQFDEAQWFQEGLASVKLDGKWGYIDKTGKMAIKPQFEDAQWFHEGLARIKLGSKLGYIDKTG